MKMKNPALSAGFYLYQSMQEKLPVAGFLYLTGEEHAIRNTISGTA